ncbi:MAG: acyloxyacyl hydrolase [Acidobacteriaceae bacterium]|nr:acyloxyacyl hydrolase [Acidobacteriaceae bacterium]
MAKESYLKLLSGVCVFFLTSAAICAFGQNMVPGVEGSNIHRKWQYGIFFQGGLPIPYPNVFRDSRGENFSIQMAFYNAGLEGGRMYTAPRGPGFLRGRAEHIVEISPLWLAHHPKQTITFNLIDPSNNNKVTKTVLWGPVTVYGTSITPLLFRWNFMRSTYAHTVPWIQGGAGLIVSSKDFPTISNGNSLLSTSKINLTPQIGIGESIATRGNQSLTLAVKLIHISSAGMGSENPGIGASINFSVGYSWWR